MPRCNRSTVTWQVRFRFSRHGPNRELEQTFCRALSSEVFFHDFDAAPIIRAAATLSEEEHLAFWDALIVQAALAAGCSILLSEDLQDGRRYRGLPVENPFRA